MPYITAAPCVPSARPPHGAYLLDPGLQLAGLGTLSCGFISQLFLQVGEMAHPGYLLQIVHKNRRLAQPVWLSG